MERSVAQLVVPVTVVAVVLAQTILVSVWVGRQADKLDTVVEATREIKSAQYTQTEAAKDLALVHTEVADVSRRVEVLEQAQHHQVVLAQARQSEREARNDDFVTRAARWFSGSLRQVK